MRTTACILAWVCCVFAAKAQLNESFSDGDFTNNPTWTGGMTDFSVTPAGKLQSANTTSNSAFYLATTNTLAVNCQWEWWCNLQFNPSGANYVDVYLTSDSANIHSSAFTGYFVRLGGSTDEVSLYKRSGSTVTKIIDGADGVLNASNTTLKIKVTRDASYIWSLSRDMGGTGTNYLPEGSVTDATYTVSAYTGVLVQQSTSSFFKKHFFDDFYIGPIIVDLTPPSLVSVSLVNQQALDLVFDENVELNTSQTTAHYSLSPANANVISATRDSANNKLVHLSVTPLVSATAYTITADQVEDLAGNPCHHSNGAFSYYKAQPYDVVFHELMVDPDPPIGLPNAEYIELKNRAAFAINLKHWSLHTNTASKILPSLTILPDSFVMLTGTGSDTLFAAMGIAAQALTGFPSLANTGTSLALRDSQGVMIHSLSYTNSWYNDPSKSNGGWSLEMVDAGNPCGNADNWRASVSAAGGTPGKENSVLAANPDHAAPSLERIAVLGMDTLLLTFSEPLDSASLQHTGAYSFDNNLSPPVAVFPLPNDFSHVKLKLSAPLQHDIIYQCTVTHTISDCAGNVVNINDSAPFALPEDAIENDVVINEVLFNPFSGGYDFVELYNRGVHVVDLKTIRIGALDTISGQLTNPAIISGEHYLFFPGTYLVLSENGNAVKQQYATLNPKGFLDVADLPTMPPDEGDVAICHANGTVIDHVVYIDNMHFPLLANHKGVSLERIDFNRPSRDRTNWNSAAAQVGFATPAYRNSQYMNADGGSGISVGKAIFSPDNDGYQDVLDISYSFDEPGKAANVFIYDAKGRQVRHLLKNEQLLQQGVISWNGINDTNERSPIGAYIVYVEVFNLKGRVNTYKLPCVLAGKL